MNKSSLKIIRPTKPSSQIAKCSMLFSKRQAKIKGCTGSTALMSSCGLLPLLQYFRLIHNLNINYSQSFQTMASFGSQNYSRFMLYIAFILSETQFLINAQLYVPKCSIPYFTLSYFILTTLYLAYAVVSYGLFSRQQKAETLQLYEYIMLPISVLCISIEGADAGMVEVKVTACILLVAQSLLIVCKIMNFSSVSEELAQISTVIRLVRTLKLVLFAILPLLVHNKTITIVIISIFQIVPFAIFLFKFTYQKFIYEYVLLIGVSCGIFSCLQSVVEAVFAFPYFFLGETLSLYLYFGQNTFLQNILQIKYTSSLKKSSESRHDDEVLAGLLFINQCLFDPQRFRNLSSHSKNQATIYAYKLLQQSRLNYIKGQVHFNQDSVFQMSQEDCTTIKLGFFENYLRKFYQTDNFNCLQFTVGKALQLKETSKALILYYGFMERRKMKMSMLQQCKYHYLYKKIAMQVDQSEKDQQDINFISFTDNLRQLKTQLEQCLTFQLKLIQSITDKNKNTQMFADAPLLRRHQIKALVRKRIALCMGQAIYFSSNEFKYLYLLYQVSIQKRFFNLELELHKYFLANEVQKLRFQTNQNSLLVLSGFNHGQIINSNQIFKNYFSVASSFNKSNIAEYLPTQKQKAKHLTLMSQFVSFQISQCSRHAEYQCYLAIEREIGALKLKTIQNFAISARIYYQNSNTFNYVCCLTPKENHNTIKKKLFLTKKDCKSFVNKGIQFLILRQNKIQQLDQSIDLCEIEFSYESQNSLLTQNLQLQEDKIERDKKIIQNNQKVEDFLHEKASSIERKLMNWPKYLQNTVFNMAEISSIVVLTLLIIGLCIAVKIGVNNYTSSITDVLDPTNEAELARNRILLQQQILSLNSQTSFFADNICSSFGIASIKAYIGNHLSNEVQEATDQFLNSINILHDYGSITTNIYSKNVQPTPYLNNYGRYISFQKYIRLMKANKFIWLNQLNSTPFNQYFYSQIFPSKMVNSTLDNPSSMSTIISKGQNQYVRRIMTTIREFSIISLVSIIALLLFVVALRLYDSRTIVEYLKIIECIPSDKLSERSKQIKCSLQQLRQLQSRRIESVQFQVSFAVQIISDKRETQNIPIKQFTEWHIQSKGENDNDQSNQSLYEDQFELMQKQRQDQPNIFFQSSFYRLISYNKLYLIFMVAAIVAVTILSNTVFMLESKRVDTLVLCNQVSLQLNQIQQKMINIVGYNWLKVLSLSTEIDMANANRMYSEAIQFLKQSNYNQKIRSAYSKDISEQILHGKVCQYFNNKTACQKYRNNIFSSGFSILNPLVIKEQIEIDKISSNPQYYISNLCDKTWLLFEGVIPMTDGIAHYGFNKMNEQIDTNLSLKLVPIASILVLVLIVSIIRQEMRKKRQSIIRQQVFSMETIERLYTVEEYKPFFNKIYYS